MKLTLSQKTREAGDAFSFFFKSKAPLSWQAGQFLAYTLDHPNPDQRGIKRYFTIASAPFEKEVMITTRINSDKGSSFKKALYNLAEGQTIEAEGPRGSFVIEDPKQKYVFLAGGIGITPFRAILLDLDHRKLPINVTLLYANRNNDFPFQRELELLAQKHRNFKIHYFAEPRRIAEQSIREIVPNLQKPIFYISGPLPMVQAMEHMLSEMGIPATHVKQDSFPGYGWP